MVKKKLSWVLVFAGLVTGAMAQAKPVKSEAKAASAASFKDENAKISYGLGLDLGKNYRRLALDVDVDQIMQGIRDGYAGQSQQIPSDELGVIMNRFQTSLKDKQAAAMKRIGEDNKRAEAAFLADNAKKEGVISQPSGLQYKILQKGSGATPNDDSWVEAHYRGKLLDGTEFDSSYRTGKPAVFKVGEATAGWREALKLMPAGSKWQLFVPSKLGYGERGAGREIMPNAMLIYEIELINANAGVGVPSSQAQ